MKLSLNKKRFILYIWLGVGYLLLWLFIDLLSNPETFFARLVNHIWLIAYLIVLNFILFEYTLPFIKLTWKRILISPFLFFGHLLLYSFGLYAWRFFGIQLFIYSSLRVHPNIESGVEYHFPYSVFSIIFFGILKHIYDYRKLKLSAQQMRIEKQEAELNYLKSQTNPHFLFNTLNNIYSLARDKSNLAPESILRLSKIMRFMLYETNGAFIAIEQELKVISDYIALEKLRYDDSLRINFNYDIEDMKQALPPLLLMPLVENAFKHGVSETRNDPFVDIHLSVNNRQLKLLVKNSVESNLLEQTVKENIGLSNLRRQLQLLFADYNLSVHQEDSAFIAALNINLASHV
ncbi:MAG: histidine kinase [Ignavibacteriales bacterium]|nr:MAG: histidine kinase [Ignavibacteriales bacterium]